MDRINPDEWLNKEPVRKFVQKNDGWFAILGHRNPSRIEIAKVPWYEHCCRGIGGARDSFGEEVMDCLLPWLVDLYNDAVQHQNSNTSCNHSLGKGDCWERFYASRRSDEAEKNAESALKSLQEIIQCIEDGTLVVPDHSKNS